MENNDLFEVAFIPDSEALKARRMPAGLPTGGSCFKCAYGGENDTMNWCKCPHEQYCHKLVRK